MADCIVVFIELFLDILQRETGSKDSCTYNLAAVIVHHGSGWVGHLLFSSFPFTMIG